METSYNFIPCEIQVTLDGSKSFDADGEISLEWIQTDGPDVILAYPFTELPWFKAPEVGESGSVLIFDLTATDSGGLVSIATCTVNVMRVENTPALDDLVITGSSSLEENTFHQFANTNGLNARR
jgi:hypothetical protein